VGKPNAAEPEPAMLDVSVEEFESLVETALATIPRELARVMRNVAIFVEDESPPNGPILLGLYEGIPLTERGQWYAGVQPDRITIFRLPILRICHTREEVVTEVTKTVVHEVGHHFGIDDARLHELGY
jgi:predicted Zn-dependent protease with MMP-like domain